MCAHVCGGGGEGGRGGGTVSQSVITIPWILCCSRLLSVLQVSFKFCGTSQSPEVKLITMEYGEPVRFQLVKQVKSQ